jgi:ABC-type transport system involved in multi-copper enzyme maturation permease subunit
MNVRIVKEIRPLLPAFALTFCGLMIALILWNAQLAYWGLVVSAFGCILMGVATFGDEFGNRTMPMLLSQPFSRQTIWREKMTVLASAISILLGAALIFLYLVTRVFVPEVVEAVVILILFCLGVFCTTPLWILLYKNAPTAAAVCVGPPILLVSIATLILNYVPALNRAAQAAVLLLPLLAYFFLCYRAGRATFLNLQALDVQSPEIALPARMERALVRPFKGMIPRFTGSWSSLINKELHLQKVNFLFAAVFCIMVPLEYVIWKFTTWQTGKDVAVGVLGATFVIYVILVPLIAGACCAAEEKSWKIHEWHLTLPPSKLKQWCVKVFTALTITLLLGVLLPGIFLAINGKWDPGFILLAVFPLPAVCLGIFASSVSTNTMRAIILTLILIILGIAVGTSANAAVDPGTRFLVAHLPTDTYVAFVVLGGVLSCPAACAFVLYLGFRNYRTGATGLRRGWAHTALILGAIWVASFMIGFSLRFYQIGPQQFRFN